MSSRWTRTLLKLFPRRIRDRYGDELLDLQDELRARGDLSRTHLIRDMLAAALLLRPARRAYLVTGAVLVIAGLAVAGTTIGESSTASPARASHPKVPLAVHSVTAMPGGSCLVADGTSCSLKPCTQFASQPPAQGAVAYTSRRGIRRRPRTTTTHCATYPHAQPQRPVLVGG